MATVVSSAAKLSPTLWAVSAPADPGSPMAAEVSVTGETQIVRTSMAAATASAAALLPSLRRVVVDILVNFLYFYGAAGSLPAEPEAPADYPQGFQCPVAPPVPNSPIE